MRLCLITYAYISMFNASISLFNAYISKHTHLNPNTPATHTIVTIIIEPYNIPVTNTFQYHKRISYSITNPNPNTTAKHTTVNIIS